MVGTQNDDCRVSHCLIKGERKTDERRTRSPLERGKHMYTNDCITAHCFIGGYIFSTRAANNARRTCTTWARRDTTEPCLHRCCALTMIDRRCANGAQHQTCPSLVAAFLSRTVGPPCIGWVLRSTLLWGGGNRRYFRTQHTPHPHPHPTPAARRTAPRDTTHTVPVVEIR